jgi:Flp pilus assembly protein TadG
MKNIKTERGQSLVELSISLLIVLWLLAGTVEFGIAFFQFIQLRDAAQEGALYGSLHPDEASNIELRVRNASDKPIDLSATTGPRAVTVTVTTPDGTSCVADSIKVSVSFNHQLFMPFASLFMDNPIQLEASVTDTILNSTC